MTRSWISDTPDEVEHPPIPLGLNKMAIPRAALVLSVVTGLGLLFSSIWVGLSAMSFLDDLEASFGTTDVDILREDGRWLWEVGLLFNTCSPREDDWEWPDSLASQDGVFLLPGEVRCDWQHQGEGDGASLVIHNRGNETLNLVIEISGGGVVFPDSNPPGESFIFINNLEGKDSKIVSLELTDDIDEREIGITATHISVLEAQVRLDVNIFDSTEEDVHVSYDDRIEVDYTVWDADDSGEPLDTGTLWVTAGEDPMCDNPVPWVCYIEGFGWSAIGLDIGSDRGAAHPVTQTGTSHLTLLPPSIAYGNSEGHELQDVWLRFELKVNRAPLSSG